MAAADALYQPKIVRSLLDLPSQQFRSWRNQLTPLRRQGSRERNFTFPELLGLAVVKHLNSDLGMRIGVIARVAPALFGICAATSVPALRGRLLMVRPQEGTAELAPTDRTPKVISAAAVLSFDAVIEPLLQRLLEASDAQLPLPLQVEA
jgi:hypothetical protein